MLKAKAAQRGFRGYRKAALFLTFLLCIASGAPAQETIVAIRHAEKPLGGLGQLSCEGLNRALALPKVLIARFGRPDAIYAPNPGVEVNDGGKQMYSYVRPLITIEPTAIALGMPVNAQIGFLDIEKLQSELTAPVYNHALIFVAWEHFMLNQLARKMLQSFGDDPSAVPPWPNSDYDRIYVFTIRGNGASRKLVFREEHEGLNGSLSDSCPSK